MDFLTWGYSNTPGHSFFMLLCDRAVCYRRETTTGGVYMPYYPEVDHACILHRIYRGDARMHTPCNKVSTHGWTVPVSAVAPVG